MPRYELFAFHFFSPNGMRICSKKGAPMDRRTFLKRMGAAGAGMIAGTGVFAPKFRGADASPLGRIECQLGLARISSSAATL
jgi:hypothetical protein